MKVRELEPGDLKEVLSWWGDEPIDESMYSKDSSFVVEANGKLLVAVTMYLLKSGPPLAWIDLLIGNPEESGKERQEATRKLLRHIENYGRLRGLKGFFCMTEKPKLKTYYENLGFRRTLEGVTTFGKGL